MDILIRKVPGNVVALIDEKAKKRGVSREEFLREQLSLISLDDEIKRVQDREAMMMNKLSKVIDLNTKVISRFMKENCISYEEVFENE
ncbi:ribbon-helix-helix protein, CopG family [Clostridium cuniculi]|uniref:ribbon-helix-helix protein, CopG family n=1 Tax=Clostridium cuniculi TaxID=2548455 RepID=UPI0010562710|nr:ribbon-helix-helix protein, CopG family [Clostridium cuniculi]